MADGDSKTTPQEARVGVWDQWCVLGDRPYSKEGDLSLMDELACRQFLDNFRKRPDDLPCNINHNKDQVVGFYDAMALFVNGQLVDVAKHDPSIPDPSLADLPVPDNALMEQRPDDGIYWHRATLTDLGRVSTQYLRKVSPEFFIRGKNQFNEEIGPLAVGGAWTNYPFLPGCEKHEFERQTNMPKKMTYAQRLFESAGCGKDEDDKSKFSRLSSYWRGQHGAKYTAYEEAAGIGKDDDESVKMRLMMAYMQRFEKDEDEDKKPEEMALAPSVEAGAPTVINNGAQPSDPVPGPGGQMTQGKVEMTQEQYQTFLSIKDQLPKVNQEVQQLKTERDQGIKARKAQEFTMAAWNAGRIIPRADETHEQAQQRIMRLYTNTGEASAKDALADPGSYTPPAAMMQTYTYSNERPTQSAKRPDEEIMRLTVERMTKAGIPDPLGTKSGGRPDHRFQQYAMEVISENPNLGSAWVNQPLTAQHQARGV